MINDDSLNVPSDNHVEQEEEIDLIALVKNLWIHRRIIICTTCICFLLGIIIAFCTKNSYTVSTIFVPQTGEVSNSNLSSLASMAGFNLASSAQGSELSPLIYPQIINSIPFKLQLMNTPVHYAKMDTAVSVFDYCTKYCKPSVFENIIKNTIGLPMVILSAFHKDAELVLLPDNMKSNIIQLTKDQNNIKKLLDNQIILTVDDKSGYLILSATMSDPLVAAEIAQKSRTLLQDYITDFKIKKSTAELDFIQQRYDAAKTKAEGFQYHVAVNSDKYNNLKSSVPEITNEQIRTQYNIANSVYLELAKQLEQAKIQVKKDTPVFTVIEPASVPLERSAPNRKMILFIWTFLGIVFGCGVVFCSNYISSFKK